MAGLVPATIIRCYALKTLYDHAKFPWHVEGELTVEALTGGKYTFNGKWKSVSVGKPLLYVGPCVPPQQASFVEDVEALLSEFAGSDEVSHQSPDERLTARNRWMTKITMQPKLYSEAIKEWHHRNA